MTEVFDHHQHVGSVATITGIAYGPTEAVGDPIEADYRTRVAVMDRLGIAQAALMPAHSYVRPRGLADTRSVNDLLANYRRRDPARFPALIGTVEPRYGDAGLDEIERMGSALAFQGVSWHHRQQGLAIDHPVMRRYVRRMAELKLVPFIHTFVDGDFESVWRLRNLAEDLPEVTFLCMDSMTERELFEEALAAGRRTPNLVFDTTSLMLGPRLIEQFVETLGPERLLFGSNLYSLARPDRLPALEAVRAARIPEAARALILGGNARRLLGVGEAA
jgi:predicted TIM-barrel fold metal-dependent hydrolase